MKKVFIEELNATCAICDSFQDLKQKDMIGVIRAVYLNPHDWQAKISLLKALFSCPPEIWDLLQRPENHSQTWRLIQTMDWVLKGPEFRPVASVRLKGRDFLLPDNDLHQLGTAEFVVATAHLIGFYNAKEHHASHLAKFMATIARPKPGIMERLKKEENGDPREAYNSAKCDARARLFDKCDLVTMIVTAQWFNNAANRLLSLFGMASKDPDAAPIGPGVFVQDWERQVVKVAESHVFGGYDQVMARPLADVLAFIELKNDELLRKAQAEKKGR
ncbi:hypothetical protein [Dyadobacter crusticola]|uniref:hypothetical protein n=1 Tax=Dyadobacter crusticola TaxID=292407 RepID=UPI0004E1BB77|nr:hypothetical protein [Dyadobacter crusticola]